MANQWTALGSYDAKAKANFFGMALAFIVASETFINPVHRYSVWMCVIVLLASCYVGWQAWQRRSWLGLGFAAIGLLWLLPLVQPSVFSSIDLWFMVAHSGYALGAGVAAFTFLKNQVKPNE